MSMNEEFGVRLRACLTEKGVSNRADQVRQVAIAAMVTPRTAARYIKGESRPRYFDDHLCGLADYLGVLPAWLAIGDGPRTEKEQAAFMKFMREMQSAPEHYQEKLRRATLLRMNGSRREHNLMDMMRSGRLSLWGYLDLI